MASDITAMSFVQMRRFSPKLNNRIGRSRLGAFYPPSTFESVHDNCSKPCLKAFAEAWPYESVSAKPIKAPMRRIRSAGCCARAATGHAAAPPSSVMNSRRRMPDTGASPSQSVRRTLSLPPAGRQVLGAGLNCSEIEVLRCTVPLEPMAGQGHEAKNSI
jgi:hypothetical protein